VDVGSLRHLVTLENPGAALPDGDGGFTLAWTALDPPQVWASIKPATARDLERAVAGTVQASASHLVTLRYVNGVSTKTRLVFGTRIFAVQGVHNVDERNRELVLACAEVEA
jgi:head-tail adaptor